MKHAVVAAGTLALWGGAAMAGGVERSTQSVAILFAPGRHVELSFGYASPDVSGSLGGGALQSGDMSGGYTNFSLGYKQALTENIDIAVILDEPIGADVDYKTGTNYPLRGTTAKLDSAAVTGLIKYRFASNVSVYGGLRAEAVKGTVAIITQAPLPAVNYGLETNRDYQLGYVVGVAWEKPEIMARVALTYNSSITHTLESSETGPVPGTSSFKTEIPQSLNLEFQSGIAKDTLLFGSVRWVDWSAFNINPRGYALIFGSPLVSYQSDRITYTLGVGRRFNANWSGAVTVAYEPSNDDITGNLGPTDGFKSIGVGATYRKDNWEITGGIRYYEIGDATTTIGASFNDNSLVAAGVKIAYTF